MTSFLSRSVNRKCYSDKILFYTHQIIFVSLKRNATNQDDRTALLLFVTITINYVTTRYNLRIFTISCKFGAARTCADRNFNPTTDTLSSPYYWNRTTDLTNKQTNERTNKRTILTRSPRVRSGSRRAAASWAEWLLNTHTNIYSLSRTRRPYKHPHIRIERMERGARAEKGESRRGNKREE